MRAVPVFGELPPGCHAELVADDRSEPILHIGEFAVVDPDQCEPINGAIFRIRYGEPGRYRREFVQVWRRDDGWWTAPYNRPRSLEEAEKLIWERRMLVCKDGPYPTTGPNVGYLASLLEGRVIGILESTARDIPRLAARS